MTERELYLKRTEAVITRLRERGIVPPAVPDGNGQEMVVCPMCQGKGGTKETKKVVAIRPYGREIIEEETKIHCSGCGGSGFKVRNALFEWANALRFALCA